MRTLNICKGRNRALHLLVRLWVCNIVEIIAYDYASSDAVKGGIPPLKDPHCRDL